MKRFLWMVIATSLAACYPITLFAQPAAKTATSVPRLVKFSGALTGADGKPLTGVVGVTFSLYRDEQGGAPLWMETQNLRADQSGRYTVVLGSTNNEGIPAEAFADGQGRWLGVQAQGESESPRTLLVSVPYALKAVDAETLGGLPASAYALAGTSANGTATQGASVAPAVSAKAPVMPRAAKDSPQATTVTGSGTDGRVALWTGSSTLGDSAIAENSSGNLGVGAFGSDTKLYLTTSETFGLYGVSSATSGVGIAGQATAASGTNWGVNGTNASTSGIGVQGVATATSGTTYGVVGISDSTGGHGVAGTGAFVSGLGASLVGSNPSGVWGDTNSGSAGVLATAGAAEAVAAYNNATNVATMFVENQTTNTSAIVFATFSGAGGFCDAFVNGNLTCSGSVGGHAVLGDSREVALYGVQAADNWMEDFGSGQLRNGGAVVTLDAEYAQTVNTGVDYHVFLTPNGDCKGLYVTQKSPASFEVHELGGGTSNIAFDYRITARRKGFENVRLEDLTGKIQRDTGLKTGAAKPALAPVAARVTMPARSEPEPEHIR